MKKLLFAIAILIGVLYLVAFAAMVNFSRSPGPRRGSDFVQFWTASRLVIEGRAKDVYDFDTFIEEEEKTLQRKWSPIVFRYPPTTLLAVTPFSYLPYALAFALAGLLPLIFIIFVTYRITNSMALVVFVLSSPVIFQNLSYGQNGLLFAGLAALALQLLEEGKDWQASVCLALCSLKPHLIILFFAALLFSRRWRTLCYAFSLSALWAAISFLVFGLSVWKTWFGTISQGTSAVFKPVVLFEALVSPWGAAYLLTSDVNVANIFQLLCSLAALLLLKSLWSGHFPSNVKNGLTCVMTILAIPYVFVYDLSFLLVALVFLLKNKSADEWSLPITVLYALSWCCALFQVPIAAVTNVSIAFFVVVTLFISVYASTPSTEPNY